MGDQLPRGHLSQPPETGQGLLAVCSQGSLQCVFMVTVHNYCLDCDLCPLLHCEFCGDRDDNIFTHYHVSGTSHRQSAGATQHPLLSTKFLPGPVQAAGNMVVCKIQSLSLKSPWPVQLLTVSPVVSWDGLLVEGNMSVCTLSRTFEKFRGSTGSKESDGYCWELLTHRFPAKILLNLTL